MGVFVMSNRNVVIPSPDGKVSVRLSRGQMCEVPDWAPKTAYFKDLAADGKLVVSGSKKDRTAEKAQREAEKARKIAEDAARKAAEEADSGETQEGQEENEEVPKGK